ncbi:MAG TPA: AMP-binding protein [Pyrinomonadaceae bacterium]
MNLFEAIFGNELSWPAVRFDGRTITYGELRAETLKMARLIQSLGVQRGDRVALLLHDCPEFIEAFIAICALGAIAVPINMSLRAEEQSAIIRNSGAMLVFSEEHVSLNNITEPEIEFPDPAENEPAFILYTSGSTGEPKGAVHRQSDIFYTNQTFCREVLQLTPRDRLFSSSRLPFAYGLGNSLSFPLLNGATTILCREKPSPDIIARIFSQHRPTIFFAVPVIYNLLLEHHRAGRKLDTSSLRLCVSAGEALPAHLGEDWEREFGVQLLDGIGSTEMLHMFISNHKNEVRYGSSGRLLQGYEARLVDEENLWVKGESAALYYWENPEATTKTFVDGWVRTGDLYRCDSDGYWFHMGRSDDCFKSSGRWVSPVEVEGVLLRHEGVARAAVVEDFDEDQLPCACAFVVRRDVESDSGQLAHELRKLAAESLPRFKQPRRYVFVTELPYTATGKIQRFKLRQQLRAAGARIQL